MSRPQGVRPSRRVVATAAALVAAAFGLAVPAGAAELETFAYGRWTGSATTDDGGAFSRCSVNATFKRASPTSGRSVATTIGMDRENGWTLGLVGGVGPSGARSEPYRLTLDGAEFLDVVPEAVAGEVALLPLAERERAFERLKAAGILTVATPDDTFDLTLAGIGRALDWVEACARRYETFVPAGREKETAAAAALRQDVAGVMRRLFETVSVEGVRVGPPPGVPEFASEDKSVPWRADSLQGEGQVWAGRDPKALANKIIKTSQGCKRRPDGERKTVRKSDPVVLAVVDCTDPVGARRVALVLMPRGKGGIYLISVHSRDGGFADVDRLGERLAEAARKSQFR